MNKKKQQATDPETAAAAEGASDSEEQDTDLGEGEQTAAGDGELKEGVELVKLIAPAGTACTTVALGHDADGSITESIDVRPGKGGLVAVSSEIVPRLLDAGYVTVRE